MTDRPQSGGVELLPAALRSLAPEATELLDRTDAWARQTVPPELLDPIRWRIAGLIGHDEASVGGAGVSDGLPADAVEFTEQFVLDVSGPMADHVARLEGRLSTSVKAFVTAVYVTEFTLRLAMVTTALLGGSPAQRTPGIDGEAVDAADRLQQALRDYQRAVVRADALDPVTTEVVRLRCARTHNCRICRTLRLADAREAGADDAMTAKIDRYETSDLDERTKAALRITDAMITMPALLAPSVVTAARALFTPEQLAELCLDITKWSTQKIHVALGTDGADALPIDPDGHSWLRFDADGQPAAFSAVVRPAGIPSA